MLIVILPKLTSSAARAKWVQNLTGAGVWLSLAAPQGEQLPRWIAARLKAAGLVADDEAIEMLTAQTEGNLLAAKQEIDKLMLLAGGERVTAEQVRAAVADGARYDVFQLADAALAGKGARAARILLHLREEGTAAPLVFWSLARDSAQVVDVALRIADGQSPGQAMGAAKVWRSRQGLIGRAVRGRDGASARRLLASVAKTERIVKGSRPGSPWNAMLELTLTLAGGVGWQAETA